MTAGTLDIAKANAVVTANSASTVYSGAQQTVSGFTATGLVGGESAAVLTGVTAGGSGKNAGSFVTTAVGSDANYNLAMTAGTLDIAKANLNLSAVSASKVYDGNTSSNGTVAVTGLVGGDTVSGASQAYVSNNVLGTNANLLQVTRSYSINDNNNGGNYLATTSVAPGTITERAQTADVKSLAGTTALGLPVSIIDQAISSVWQIQLDKLSYPSTENLAVTPASIASLLTVEESEIDIAPAPDVKSP